MNWNLKDAHKVCTYALVGIAFAALLTGHATHPLANGVFLLLGVVSWFWEPPRIRWEQYAKLWMPLTVGVLVVLVGAIGLLRAHPLDVSLYLLLYLTLAKLFQRERPEDYNQAMALSFLLLAASTVYTSDILFGLLFALYVILGVVNFTLYHLRVQVREHGKAAAQSRLFNTRVLVMLVWVGLATFILSVGLFFLFPRIGLGFFGRGGAGQRELGRGFGEQVHVGDHGRLDRDTRVVMRVEFPEGAPPPMMPLYWRGVSFDLYDGQTWKRTLSQGEFRAAQDRLVELQPAPANLPLLRQDIYLEPSSHLILFALNPLYRVRLPETAQSVRIQVGTLGDAQQPARIIHQWGRSLFVTRTGDVYYTYRGEVGYQYTAWSRPMFPRASDLRRVDANLTLQQLAQAGLKEPYLQLPANFNPRIRELAADLTRNAPTLFDKVQAIRSYLAQNFTYTTDLPDPGDQPVVDAFLFTHRRGHCEYFATAMTLMLRSIGIPARLVNGYLGGRWNAYDHYLAVQVAHAHSWVEVPFAGYGWLTFDPTPPGFGPQTGNWWSDLLDALRFRWNKYVLEYNLDTQLEGLKQVQTWLQPPAKPGPLEKGLDVQQLWRVVGVLLVTVAAGLGGYQRRGRPLRLGDGLGLGVSIGLNAWIAGPLPWPWSREIGGLAPALAFFIARYLRWGQAKANVSPVSRLYLQLREALVEQGLAIEPAMGPLAVRQQLETSDLPDREIAVQVIDTYMTVRFGGQSLSPAALDAYRAQVRHLLQRWRTRQRQKVLH
ncbi:MAG: DUF3488 and transglutaminase-like domain-containing protein [Gloeomargarita sp. SKYBB_i_bin120]|nr:DUF3488 and transglutaminase-like domain-containing protein [Gloeomargarita sp. SKYG98]MCS7292432.1 DUF3488 and transglutaminase-like domain-containing protein [Gloeomargarita sp. SKYB120]MDW8177993.1 DUF3488 and transglutaminase-like domain-containing protein [Gloeomargarita sp. SKYBB_i_bin120]